MASDTQQTIVIVDDEPDILATLATYLSEHLDVDVEAFERSPPALERVQAGGVDLLLTDYRMPEMDGLALVARCHEAIKDLGVMVITAYPDMELAIRAINEGRIMHFFTKPPEPEELVQVIREYLADLRRSHDRKAAFERALEMGRQAARRADADGT